jgi:hypothetical protein
MAPTPPRRASGGSGGGDVDLAAPVTKKDAFRFVDVAMIVASDWTMTGLARTLTREMDRLVVTRVSDRKWSESRSTKTLYQMPFALPFCPGLQNRYSALRCFPAPPPSLPLPSLSTVLVAASTPIHSCHRTFRRSFP